MISFSETIELHDTVSSDARCLRFCDLVLFLAKSSYTISCRLMVVKRFKTPLGQDVNKVHAPEAYLEQMEVQTVAAYMAEQFNLELARYCTIRFYTCSLQ